jgi:hypothetical protein
MPRTSGSGRATHDLTGRRRASTLTVVGLCLLAVAALNARPVAAHQPLLIGSEAVSRATARRIPDADIAWAAFGTLAANSTQFLVFARPASGRFRARALVGTFQANTALNPWLALVGPGLPRPDGLDGLLADGEGAILVAPPADRTIEPFQATPFPVLVGASLEVTLPTDGPYFLLVFDPAGLTGPYVIDTGYLLD